MAKAFTLIYKTPHGTVRAEADTQRELAGMVHDEISRMLMPVNDLDGMSLDEAVGAVLDTYKSVSWGRRQARGATRLYQQDRERDAIRCYLKGLTIKQSLEYLTAKKNASVSKSALGRFFRRLFELDVRPLKTDKRRTSARRHAASSKRGTEA